MLYDFLNQKEYIDISKINTCSAKSITEIIREYCLLISRSFEHFISPSFDKILNIKLVFNDKNDCNSVYNEIKNLQENITDKYVLMEKILLKLKNLNIKYDFTFLPNVSEYNNNNKKADEIKNVQINNKQDFSFNIKTVYDFFIFIKLNNGPYSNDINKLINYMLAYCIKKLNNIFEFDFTIKSITDKSVCSIYFNIYYQYEQNKKNCQYLLITDIFANNPIKINYAFEEFQKYAYFDDILKQKNF